MQHFLCASVAGLVREERFQMTGVGGTVDSEPALRSAKTLLSRTEPRRRRPDGEPEGMSSSKPNRFFV
ncbi:hypothetical protein PoB_005359700 [Plakobranchus ocellatus]|uniref:Uncharacterized protein n=1 Tax=Plakobranchus ocellatus TaxID=259542 RepID=A0AAV4C744_9GAST|nr:hypothetical protein PoB_005359700 [Plakobranchus ocellatus]